MVEVKDLVKEFKVENKIFKAVNSVSFSVAQGEIYGIIGLSGAGKSTLIRCLNRLEEPTSGSIKIDDKIITSLNQKELLEERKDIGMIFQSFNLFEQKTVYKNIAYPLELLKMDKEKIDTRVNELLEFVDLVDKKNAYPSEISGGQKQRVAIARAIATSPKLLLSDEGTSALDPANTKQILELLKKIVKELGMTIIMITHQMEVAKDICDRIAVMENGKIIEENTVEELFRNPKNKRTLSFIENLQESDEDFLINKNDFKGKLIRLTYDNNTSKEPVLSEIVKKYNTSINLIQGKINKVTDKSIGYMIVEVTGDNQEIGKVLDYLEEKNVKAEVL
ncbi:methionine ABC transporter ATP-binding protein [Miniphocaeibacter massiliensis]|uniref:methionine ABC transporter ATP-binding protein n=1 Tax=Miniphocaeibacter massiliensis TaxID=2041841 RepID=UPI000C1B84FE|nr:methionine ABC transporter ATP-binding protein [Miniphocaeibacter massiliensis]